MVMRKTLGQKRLYVKEKTFWKKRLTLSLFFFVEVGQLLRKFLSLMILSII